MLLDHNEQYQRCIGIGHFVTLIKILQLFGINLNPILTRQKKNRSAGYNLKHIGSWKGLYYYIPCVFVFRILGRIRVSNKSGTENKQDFVIMVILFFLDIINLCKQCRLRKDNSCGDVWNSYTLMCLPIGTPNITTFTFVPNRKRWLLDVSIVQHITIRL